MGIVLVLVRWRDWFETAEERRRPDFAMRVKQRLFRLADALSALQDQYGRPPLALTFADPNSPLEIRLDIELKEELARTGLEPLHQASAIDTPYPVFPRYDPAGEEFFHSPFSELYSTAIATFLARLVFGTVCPPRLGVVANCISKGPDPMLDEALERAATGRMITFTPYSNLAEVVPAHDAILTKWGIQSSDFVWIDPDPDRRAYLLQHRPQTVTVDADPAVLTHIWCLDALKPIHSPILPGPSPHFYLTVASSLSGIRRVFASARQQT